MKSSSCKEQRLVLIQVSDGTPSPDSSPVMYANLCHLFANLYQLYANLCHLYANPCSKCATCEKLHTITVHFSDSWWNLNNGRN